MGWVDYVIIAGLILLITVAIVSVVRTHSKGDCSGNCSACSECKEKKDDNEEILPPR